MNESSRSGFDAAPAQAGPSLVGESELRRAELRILEWADRHAVLNDEDLASFLDENRDLRTCRSLTAYSHTLSTLVRLVGELRNERLLYSARRLLNQPAAAADGGVKSKTVGASS